MNNSLEESPLATLPSPRRRQAEHLLQMVKRIMEEEAPSHIHSPQDVYHLLAPEMSLLPNEHFVALLLNVKNRILSKETISIGTLDKALVHPREVFRKAIVTGAASILCVHNHPSGDPTPSEEDVIVTKRLADAGAIIGIGIMDHIIIGHVGYVSLREQGMIVDHLVNDYIITSCV